MDAFAIYAFGFTGLLWGGVGYLLGRIQRELRYRRDAAANLARANERTNQRRNARAYANRITVADDDDGTDTGTDSDSDSSSHDTGTGAGIDQTRRRTVHRAHRRDRPLSVVSDGDLLRTDETALSQVPA